MGNSGQTVAALGWKSQGGCCHCDTFSLTKLEPAPLGFSIRLCLWEFSSRESDFNMAPTESVKAGLLSWYRIEFLTRSPVHHAV